MGDSAETNHAFQTTIADALIVPIEQPFQVTNCNQDGNDFYQTNQEDFAVQSEDDVKESTNNQPENNNWVNETNQKWQSTGWSDAAQEFNMAHHDEEWQDQTQAQMNSAQIHSEQGDGDGSCAIIATAASGCFADDQRPYAIDRILQNIDTTLERSIEERPEVFFNPHENHLIDSDQTGSNALFEPSGAARGSHQPENQRETFASESQGLLLLKQKIIDTSSILKENSELQLRLERVEEELRQANLSLDSECELVRKYKSDLACKNSELSEKKMHVFTLENQLKQFDMNVRKQRKEKKGQDRKAIESLQVELRDKDAEIMRKQNIIVQQAATIQALKGSEKAPQPSTIIEIEKDSIETMSVSVQTINIKRNEVAIQCEIIPSKVSSTEEQKPIAVIVPQPAQTQTNDAILLTKILHTVEKQADLIEEESSKQSNNFEQLIQVVKAESKKTQLEQESSCALIQARLLRNATDFSNGKTSLQDILEVQLAKFQANLLEQQKSILDGIMIQATDTLRTIASSYQIVDNKPNHKCSFQVENDNHDIIDHQELSYAPDPELSHNNIEDIFNQDVEIEQQNPIIELEVIEIQANSTASVVETSIIEASNKETAHPIQQQEIREKIPIIKEPIIELPIVEEPPKQLKEDSVSQPKPIVSKEQNLQPSPSLKPSKAIIKNKEKQQVKQTKQIKAVTPPSRFAEKESNLNNLPKEIKREKKIVDKPNHPIVQSNKDQLIRKNLSNIQATQKKVEIKAVLEEEDVDEIIIKKKQRKPVELKGQNQIPQMTKEEFSDLSTLLQKKKETILLSASTSNPPFILPKVLPPPILLIPPPSNQKLLQRPSQLQMLLPSQFPEAMIVQEQSSSPTTEEQLGEQENNTILGSGITPSIAVKSNESEILLFNDIHSKGLQIVLQEQLRDCSGNYYKVVNSHFALLQSMSSSQIEKHRDFLSSESFSTSEILLTTSYKSFSQCAQPSACWGDYTQFLSNFLHRDILKTAHPSYESFYQVSHQKSTTPSNNLKDQTLLMFNPFDEIERQKFLVLFTILCAHFRGLNLRKKSLELLHYCLNGGLNCDFIYLFLNLDATSIFSYEPEQSDEGKKLSYLVTEDILSELASKKNYYSFTSKDSDWIEKPTGDSQQHNQYTFMIETLKILIVIVLHEESIIAGEIESFSRQVKVQQMLLVILGMIELSEQQRGGTRTKIEDAILKKVIVSDIERRIPSASVGYRKRGELFFAKPKAGGASFKAEIILQFLLNFYIVVGDRQLVKWLKKNEKTTMLHFNYRDFLGSFDLVMEVLYQMHKNNLKELADLVMKIYSNVLKGYFQNPKYTHTVLKTMQIINTISLSKVLPPALEIIEISQQFQKVIDPSLITTEDQELYLEVDSSIVSILYI